MEIWMQILKNTVFAMRAALYYLMVTEENLKKNRTCVITLKSHAGLRIMGLIYHKLEAAWSRFLAPRRDLLFRHA